MRYANNLYYPSNVQYGEQTIPVFSLWFGSWQFSVQRRALNLSQLTRFYDLAAPGWSKKLARLGFPEAYETLLRKVLSEETPSATGARLRALDCGVGTGALSCALARALPAPFKLDAIDISQRMLERASSNLCDSGLDVSLRHGDVRELPYRTGDFDLVITGHVLEHLADPGVALGEMVRVLKPGGLIIACLTRRSLLGAYVQLKWRTHRVTPSQAENWLLKSGLQNVRCISFDQGTLCQRLSVVCVGRKPNREMNTRSIRQSLNQGSEDSDASAK